MKKVLIVDIETTGFSRSKNQIVEIGIVELDLDTGVITTLYSEFIKEQGITQEIIEKSWIFKNSDITVENILTANSLEDEFEEIQAILMSYPLGITAFNNSFDLGFLQARGFTWHQTLQCPMELSKPIVRAEGKRGLKNPNMEEAYNHFFPGSDYVETHRGADDAEHEAKIVYALWKRGVF